MKRLWWDGYSTAGTVDAHHHPATAINQNHCTYTHVCRIPSVFQLFRTPFSFSSAGSDRIQLSATAALYRIAADPDARLILIRSTIAQVHNHHSISNDGQGSWWWFHMPSIPFDTVKMPSESICSCRLLCQLNRECVFQDQTSCNFWWQEYRKQHTTVLVSIIYASSCFSFLLKSNTTLYNCFFFFDVPPQVSNAAGTSTISCAAALLKNDLVHLQRAISLLGSQCC
jgi:hypothetical protein